MSDDEVPNGQDGPAHCGQLDAEIRKNPGKRGKHVEHHEKGDGKPEEDDDVGYAIACLMSPLSLASRW